MNATAGVQQHDSPIAQLVPKVVAIAEAAGRAVLAYYDRPEEGASTKDDGSPVTAADRASHECIVAGLQGLGSWPVLSEESAQVPYETRRTWRRFWLVDPLDGTREFLKRNGEFTVNIAFVEDGRPVLGVVHAPALGVTYHAARGAGAYKVEKGRPERIVCRQAEGRIVVVVSRSHSDEHTDEYLRTLGEHERLSIGSSLKFCLVAEGRASLYPRFGTTMEWDIAAAVAVLEEAGGSVRDLGGRPLAFNKPDLANPPFIASA